ncbi:MAG: sodium:alanine symporter family protein [Butyricicoccus sp.]|nr:sodium:alanine symporter family protein [Butyricicoccus sp.]
MELIKQLRYALWGPCTILLFVLTGLMLTLRTHGVQFWCWRQLLRRQKQNHANGLTPFQALCTSLGGTMGVGNLAGVASAITLGGPGAVFYMMLAAFFGMATKYAELLLAVRYRDTGQEPLGGPMVYLTKAGMPFSAKLSAVCCILCVLGTGAASQGGAIAESAAALLGLPRPLIGCAVMLLVLPVLKGGGKCIGRIASVLVPLMTVLYLAGGGAVLCAHWDRLPNALLTIWEGAKEPAAAGGGILGLLTARAVSNGFSKGVFSHEAGMGSAPIAHGCSSAEDPCAEGLLGAVEVFIDTCVVCLMTALCILCTDAPGDGLARTTAAFETVFGAFTEVFLTIIIIFLALSTILGWSFYGFACLRWFRAPRWLHRLYPYAVALSAGLAAFLPLTDLLLIADIAAACMAFPNLIGLWVLSGDVAQVTKSYLQKK